VGTRARGCVDPLLRARDGTIRVVEGEPRDAVDCVMLEEADPALLARVDERLVEFMRRVEQGFAARG